MSETSKEITRSGISDDVVASIQTTAGSLEDIEQFFQSQGIAGEDNETDGILSLDVVENKDSLIGVEFWLLRWRFNTSDKHRDKDGNPTQFVSAEIAYKKDGALTYDILNDGSTGIRDQLLELTRRRITANNPNVDPYGVRKVRRGLRKSEYDFDGGKKNAAGEVVLERGVTYYLSF